MKQTTLQERLRVLLSPKRGQQARIKRQMMARIAVSAALHEAQKSIRPAAALRRSIWSRIDQRITVKHPVALLDQVRAVLAPSGEVGQIVKQAVRNQLLPQSQVAYGWTKWVASFAVVALLIQIGPTFLLAPRTVAESKVILIPTAGEVAVSVAGLWEEVHAGDELVLEPGMRVRTYDGQATVVFRDDAVVRMDEDTILAVHDTSPRIDTAPEVMATFTLADGRVWLQGLVPATVRGITMSTSFGHVTVNEGSVSVRSTEDDVAVKVWDRRALVAHNGESTLLSVGEQTDLRERNVLLTKKIPDVQFDEDWPKQNLARDAVHRRYIAHLQHERLVSLAGILPTSSLYPAKRMAERMDVLLSFSEEERVEKLLNQADTRRNEAAALLARGSLPSEEEVADTLAEYKESLIQLASGSGGDMVTHFLIKQRLNEMSAEVAAAQPGDDSYVLKQVVLELATALPEEFADTDEAQTTLLVDALDVLTTTLEAGGTVAIEETWHELQEHLAYVEHEDSTVDPLVRKQVHTLLAKFAEVVEAQREELADIDPELIDDIVAFLPADDVVVTRVQLTDTEILAAVDAMYDRIYRFAMPQSRMNQLQVELNAIANHDEEGRFLRALYDKLPEGSRMTNLVRKQIVRLRWEKAAEVVAEPAADQAVEL